MALGHGSTVGPMKAIERCSGQPSLAALSQAFDAHRCWLDVVHSSKAKDHRTCECYGCGAQPLARPVPGRDSESVDAKTGGPHADGAEYGRGNGCPPQWLEAVSNVEGV